MKIVKNEKGKYLVKIDDNFLPWNIAMYWTPTRYKATRFRNALLAIAAIDYYRKMFKDLQDITIEDA